MPDNQVQNQTQNPNPNTMDQAIVGDGVGTNAMPDANITSSVQDTNVNDPNFAMPTPQVEMTANQLANQGVPPEDASQPELKEVPPQENAVQGRSELLNANEILTNILNLKVGQRAADLGAGGGLFTIQAARLVGDQGEVYAVDIMKNILSDIESKARMANLYNIKTVWSNIEILGATKIPEDTLDYVFLINTLSQSKEHDKMLAEAIRLLKAGGKMLIIDWLENKVGLGPQADNLLQEGDVIEKAQAMGLRLEQQFKAGQYHFGVVFIK